MEKYKELTDITKEYLNGELSDLDIHYKDDLVDIHIRYQDNLYSYDYDMQINKMMHTIKHITHRCFILGTTTNLKRNTMFEHAVESYLFHD